MCRRSLAVLVIISSTALLLGSMTLAQDNGKKLPDPSQQPHISDIINGLAKNGLAEARVGLRTSSKPVIEDSTSVVREDAYPALSLFYSEGFRVIRGDSCGVTLRNDNTRLLAHSKLIHDTPPDQHISAELYIPLDKLSVKKGKGPYRHTTNPDKAQLLGTWRTELKSTKSQEDVVLTIFAPGQTEKLRVWNAETLTFTFESKETSEKFTAAFRQAIKICQPIKFLMR